MSVRRVRAILAENFCKHILKRTIRIDFRLCLFALIIPSTQRMRTRHNTRKRGNSGSDKNMNSTKLRTGGIKLGAQPLFYSTLGRARTGNLHAIIIISLLPCCACVRTSCQWYLAVRSIRSAHLNPPRPSINGKIIASFCCGCVQSGCVRGS